MRTLRLATEAAAAEDDEEDITISIPKTPEQAAEFFAIQPPC